MSEQPSTHNELGGHVGGPTVQAGAIHGDVVFPAAPWMSPEQAELQQRSAERMLRQFDAEDAERQRQEVARRQRWEEKQRELAAYLKFVRRRKRICEVALLLVGAVMIGLWLTVPFERRALMPAVIWSVLFAMVGCASWLPRWKVLHDAGNGRKITVPSDRKKW